MDNFEGPVRIEIIGVPHGFHVTTPLVIEKGLIDAEGSVNADAGTKPIRSRGRLEVDARDGHGDH